MLLQTIFKTAKLRYGSTQLSFDSLELTTIKESVEFFICHIYVSYCVNKPNVNNIMSLGVNMTMTVILLSLQILPQFVSNGFTLHWIQIVFWWGGVGVGWGGYRVTLRNQTNPSILISMNAIYIFSPNLEFLFMPFISVGPYWFAYHEEKRDEFRWVNHTQRQCEARKSLSPSVDFRATLKSVFI